MNKREVINAIAEELEWPKNEVKDCLDCFEQVVTNALCSGENITLTGFAKFSVKDKPATAARKGRNPFTGEQMTFKAKPASLAVRLSPLKALKDTVAASKRKKR